MLTLHQYPDKIAEQQRQLLQIEQALRVTNHRIEVLVLNAEKTVQFDETLKNEGQRKARRTELLQATDDYELLLQSADRLKDERVTTQIEVDRLERLFSIAKLEKREAIATLERSAA